MGRNINGKGGIKNIKIEGCEREMTFLLIPDIWRAVIARYLSPKERLAVGGTCRRMRRLFPPALREMPVEASLRIRELLQKRELSPTDVDSALLKIGAVLTGSLVVQAIMGVEWQSDIDIIIPAGGCLGLDVTPDVGRLLRAVLTKEQLMRITRTNLYDRYKYEYMTIDELISNKDRVARLKPSGYLAALWDDNHLSYMVYRLNGLLANPPPKSLPDILYGRFAAKHEYKSKVLEIIESFDLSCCKCVYDGKYCYVSDPGMLQWQTRLNPLLFSVSSVMTAMYAMGRSLRKSRLRAHVRKRVEKYEQRGFRVSGTELIDTFSGPIPGGASP